VTVTVAADVRALWCALHDLRDAVLPVRMLVVEDWPEEVVPRPVLAVADGLDSVFGRLQQAVDELSAAIDGDGGTRSREHVVTALGRCNTTFVTLGQEWTEQVGNYRRLAQLVMAARERGQRAWALSVVDGVDACERTRDQVAFSLLACWQGLAEQAGLPGLPRTPLPRRRSDESVRHEQEDRGRSGHGGRGPGEGGEARGQDDRQVDRERRPGDAAHQNRPR
jgi:hypothetical protein